MSMNLFAVVRLDEEEGETLTFDTVYGRWENAVAAILEDINSGAHRDIPDGEILKRDDLLVVKANDAEEWRTEAHDNFSYTITAVCKERNVL